MEESPPHRLIAFVDEAGDAGGKYGAGSSQFLVIGCAVMALADVPSILSVFDETRAERKHSRELRKFSDTPDKDNFVLTKLLGKKQIRMIQVALHKPSMDGTHLRNNPQDEYHYLVKYALERVSWLARDAARGQPSEHNRCKLVFSEQKLYPYEELCNYLNRLRNGQERYNCSIEWDYLDSSIGYQPHQNEQAIHLADTAASAFHRAIEPKMHGMVDDRFAQNLFPAVYRRKGQYYGVKLFPPREIEKMKERGFFGFLRLLP